MKILLLDLLALGLATWALTACQSSLTSVVGPVPSVQVLAATADECANGGTTVVTFLDVNHNGKQDTNEEASSKQKICNGEDGAKGPTGDSGPKGADGKGAGIEIVAASGGACPAGGQVLKTFIDADNDGVRSTGETVTSVSTLCNG